MPSALVEFQVPLAIFQRRWTGVLVSYAVVNVNLGATGALEAAVLKSVDVGTRRYARRGGC